MQPNFRVGLRQLPWRDRVAPPPPSTVEEFYEGADAKILSAGYHEGATYFELLDFVTKSLKRDGIPTVDVDDGLLAVTLGVAAHISIDEKRICEIDSLLSKDLIDELRTNRLLHREQITMANKI